MPHKWKRPESVPFPSIWRRFEGRKEMNGKIPKFWIQDIPEEMFDEAMEIMCKDFIHEEPLCKYSNLADEPEAVEEIRATWRETVKDKLGLICFMENPNPAGKPIIAGLNMTFLCEKDEELQKYESKKWLKVKSTVKLLSRGKDAFEEFGITEYLSALGLSVLPEFRGQNIGFELLEARTDLCRAVGLKATLTVFSAIASQKLAERSGFKDFMSMSYEEIEKLYPCFRYPGITENTKCCRYMYKLI